MFVGDGEFFGVPLDCEGEGMAGEFDGLDEAIVRVGGRAEAVAELLALQADYAAWADALPDSLRDTATAEALQAMVDLDLDALTVIEPPRGYGRD